jgi:integrase
MAKARGIYKRYQKYWIRYAGLDGRMILESSHSNKFKDAETLLIKRRQEIQEGKQPEIPKKIVNHTFRELGDEYRKWSEIQKSFNSKKYFINQLVGFFGNMLLRQVSTKLLEEYQREGVKKGNKPATINRHIACLKHMYSKALDWEWVEEHAFKKVKKVKLLPENNRRLRYLSPEECGQLLSHCDSHLRPIVVTALHTGMRKAEILTLKWINIDFKNRLILLEITKNGERREIPINDTLMLTLQELPRRIDGHFVFYDPKTDKPYKDVRRSFATACRKAGTKDFHFHDTRHTFASHLVMEGADLTTVKELLGHKSLAMTLRYAHLAPKHRADAVRLLDKRLRSGLTSAETKQEVI